MANIKSAKKRIKVTEAKTAQNRMIKSALKTAIKKFETAVAANNAEEANVLFPKLDWPKHIRIYAISPIWQ